MSLAGFESEQQIEDRKRKRQEEWEKVRNPEEDPAEAPEETYDPRSLYERLKEQKDKKDMEFEESKKFKNLIHTLDDDEIIHLNTVDDVKLMQERQQKQEELKEINDYRQRVAELQELSSEQKISILTSSKPKSIVNTQKTTTQKSILSAAVKRKAPSGLSEPTALKCVAIRPGISGIVDYKSSDESDSSDFEVPIARDLIGRQIKLKKEDE